VAGPKRDRQREAREARRAAEAAAARKAQARKRTITFGIGLVVVVAIAFTVSRGKDTKTTVSSGSTSTSQPTPAGGAGSAAGKPCVDVADPLPAGAPAVPVKVGAPPAKLVKEDLKAGAGATVTSASTVTVNYIGVSCSSGKIFDSSYSRNQPATFPLTGVIKGWQEGIPGMQVGGQRLLGIPPAQAYGPAGQPPTIAPDETLWFVVEVVDAK